MTAGGTAFTATRKSLRVPPAMPTAIVAANTRIMGAGRRRDWTCAPSRVIIA
jgi:hypothetical protein